MRAFDGNVARPADPPRRWRPALGRQLTVRSARSTQRWASSSGGGSALTAGWNGRPRRVLFSTAAVRWLTSPG